MPHNRQADIKKVAKILRDGGYTYQQSKHLIEQARKLVGLKVSPKKTGAVDRLNQKEFEALLSTAYNRSGVTGLMLRTLLETGSRVSAFVRMQVEDISFSELEIRVTDKGDKTRDIPILESLANELRLHLGNRETGYVFPSRQGGHYSTRRLQQLVKELAKDAGITKNVYPHLLRHTMAQYLADNGMPIDLLQKFLGHTDPATTQIYYEPNRMNVKRSHREAMGGGK